MTQEFTKYDSDTVMHCHNIRLTKDAQKISDTFVKVTFCLTSKNDKDEDMWVDAIPLDSGVALASQLKKGDVLSASGFLTMQRWGDDNDKVSHTLKFAKFHYPLDLLMELKARDGGTAKAKAKPPATRMPSKSKPAKEVVDLDDDIE